MKHMGAYKRVLLKLSGESLAGGNKLGIEAASLESYAKEIQSIVEKGIQTAIVLGGGNIFRGIHGSKTGIDRVQGDYMGMLATIINSMALQSALANLGIKATVLSGIPIDTICAKMNRVTAIQLLEEGQVVIIAGGTGNPFFTTDSSAALRAAEIKADVILKGTRVDGVYSADPEKDPEAVKYDRLSFEEAYNKNLKVMDLTAFTICRENNIPVIVFDVNKPGILYELLVESKPHGTVVS
jgi:uridylate kinase